MTDKIRKWALRGIPYLFALWFCLKLGTAYRLAAGVNFGIRLTRMMATIGPAFADI